MNPIKREIHKIQLLERLTSELWKFLTVPQKDDLNKLYCDIFYKRDKYTTKEIKAYFTIWTYDNNINLNT